MAGGPGFEPGLTESESVVLPLDDPPTVGREAAPKGAAVCLRPIKRALLYHMNPALLSPLCPECANFRSHGWAMVGPRLGQGRARVPSGEPPGAGEAGGRPVGCGTAASGRRLAGLCTMGPEIPQDGKSRWNSLYMARSLVLTTIYNTDYSDGVWRPIGS